MKRGIPEGKKVLVREELFEDSSWLGGMCSIFEYFSINNFRLDEILYLSYCQAPIVLCLEEKIFTFCTCCVYYCVLGYFILLYILQDSYSKSFVCPQRRTCDH